MYVCLYRIISGLSSPWTLLNLSKLSLSNNPDLSGQFPSEVGLATRLQELSWSHTSVSGPIPPSLGTSLSLSGGWVWHVVCVLYIYIYIGSLSELTSLVLASNQLTSVDASIFLTLDLIQLDLSDNLLSGPLPSSFSV